MEPSDHELLEQYLQGDAEAIATLVEKYRRSLFGFIGGMTSGREDAEEIFQEVWFRVIRKVENYRHQNFSGWLIRIAHNLVIDRARRRRSVVSLDESKEKDGPEGFDLPARVLSPMQEMADSELGNRIREAVRRLPLEQREVFLMRTQMDLPFREIARAQKTSINTALARMHYSLAKLRHMLQKDYDEISGEGAANGTSSKPALME